MRERGGVRGEYVQRMIFEEPTTIDASPIIRLNASTISANAFDV